MSERAPKNDFVSRFIFLVDAIFGRAVGKINKVEGAMLSAEQISRIRQDVHDGIPITEVAANRGVARQTVYNVLDRHRTDWQRQKKRRCKCGLPLKNPKKPCLRCQLTANQVPHERVNTSILAQRDAG